MKPDRWVHVITLHAGEPEFGVWCDKCLLPAALTFPILDDDDRLMGETTVCPDCDSPAYL